MFEITHIDNSHEYRIRLHPVRLAVLAVAVYAGLCFMLLARLVGAPVRHTTRLVRRPLSFFGRQAGRIISDKPAPPCR